MQKDTRDSERQTPTLTNTHEGLFFWVDLEQLLTNDLHLLKKKLAFSTLQNFTGVFHPFQSQFYLT